MYLKISKSSNNLINTSYIFSTKLNNNEKILNIEVIDKNKLLILIESAFMTPFAIIVFYLLSKDGNNFFSPSDLKISFWLFLAGAMTLIPLYLYLKGVELAGLGPTGMIFFLAPTGQFLLGVFYYGEYLDINKLISFVIIWIAVTIYLHDLSREKVR